MDDVNVLIIFYSRGGLTERIAVWLAEGAVQAGARIRLRRARDIESEEIIQADPAWAASRDRMHEEFAAPTEADVAWADVLAMGTPATAKPFSPELAAFLNRIPTEGLQGKIGTGFTSAYIPEANGESALKALEDSMNSMGLTVFSPVFETSSSDSTDWHLAHAHGHQVVAMARAKNQEQLDRKSD